VRLCQIEGVWSREDILYRPGALTSWVRLLPPTFGVRNWYIMRLDRSLQGLPTRKIFGGLLRLLYYSFTSQW